MKQILSFHLQLEKISGPQWSIKITDYFTCTSANVIDCITCTLCKKLDRWNRETTRWRIPRTPLWRGERWQKSCDLHEVKTWACDMIMWYWSEDTCTLLWQVSTDHNMNGLPVPKMYAVNQGCMSGSTNLLAGVRPPCMLGNVLGLHHHRAHIPAIHAASHIDH